MTWAPANLTENCFVNSYISSCLPSFITFLSYLIKNFGHSKDDKFNTPHQSSHHVNEDDQYDFIIVGAGSAGSVVANRLSEIKHLKILLLEGGNEQPLISEVPGTVGLLSKSNIDYNYSWKTEAGSCKNVTCPIARGKVMGGSSSINLMVYVRGNKLDFNNWAQNGNSGWSYNDVLPYFKKSEDLRNVIPYSNPSDHSTGGYLGVSLAGYDKYSQSVIDSWKELGYEEVDYNSGNQVGVAKFQYNIKDKVRQSSNAAFIRPIRGKRWNLKVRPNSHVIKIIIDEQSKRAIGVEYVKAGDNYTRKAFATKEVIVSAGVYNSPKLLMLSGIGPADELREMGIKIIKETEVGKNLQDHPSVLAISLNLDSEAATFKDAKAKKRDIELWLSRRKSPFDNIGLDVVTFFQSSFETRPNVPDLQVSFFTSVNEKDNKGRDSVINAMSYYNRLLVATLLTAPKSRGWVKLNKTDPIWGNPLIYPNLFADPQDALALAEGIKYSIKFTETKAFNKTDFSVVRIPMPLCENFLSNEMKYYECVAREYAVPSNHATGTCKMGPVGDPNAVVDSRLRVHGIKNLRVIDASIMPTITRGSSNAATVMIGEKGSDMIKEDWSLICG